MSVSPVNALASQTRKVRKASIAPKWSRQVSSASSQNASYFISTHNAAPESINDSVFVDQKQNIAYRQDLEARMIRNEQNKNYGITKSIHAKTQDQEMQGFGKGAINQVTRSSLKENIKSLKRNAENALSGAREPVAAAFLLATVYTGKVMRFSLAEDIKVESRASVRDREASLGLAMPAGWNSSVKYAANGNDNGVNAQLSKQIDNNISAVVDTASKGSFKLVYGVSF